MRNGYSSATRSANASQYRRFVRQEYAVLSSKLKTRSGQEMAEQIESLLDYCRTLSSPSKEFAFIDGIMRLKKCGGGIRFRPAA